MAKIPEGILGKLIGRVGPVTGFLRNGQNVLAANRGRTDKKITARRTAQREKIKYVMILPKHFPAEASLIKAFLLMAIRAQDITGQRALL